GLAFEDPLQPRAPPREEDLAELRRSVVEPFVCELDPRPTLCLRELPRGKSDRRWQFRREDVDVSSVALDHAHEAERGATDHDGLEPESEVEEMAIERFDGRSREHVEYRLFRY
ncbi:MAG: hypothetical protein JNK45_10605, partial [Myxococcales bacterium]|nr:hypothetical protein [Myxococcales bacterium]